MCNDNTTSLGAFSVSLAVKDLEASKTFYQTLGFEKVGGEEAQKWLILRNGYATIGLFEGMFDGNILTFNPGWDAQCNTLARFEDVRELQRRLRSLGLGIGSEADEDGSGPGSFTLTDPDGNAILIDQHVSSKS